MQFDLSVEQEQIRSLVSEIAKDMVSGGAKSRDEQAVFDMSLFGKLGELGLTAVLIPEEFGGGGGGAVGYAIALEELSAVCASTAAVLAAHQAFCVWPLYRLGSDLAKQEALAKLASGEALGGCALLQGSAGPTFTSRRLRDGYSFSGSHHYVLNSPDAHYYTLIAGTRSRRSLQLFIVPAEQSGLRKGEAGSKLGLRGFPTASLYAEDCCIPKHYRMGRKDQVRGMMQELAILGDIGAAAQSVGLAQAALNQAVHYARTRRQFGDTIGTKQGIAFKLADMKVQVEASSLLLYQAAWRMDNEQACSREAALARVYSSSAAVYVAVEAVQIWGGYGYIREVGIERLLRDAVCIESDYGTGAMSTNPLSRILAN